MNLPEEGKESVMAKFLLLFLLIPLLAVYSCKKNDFESANEAQEAQDIVSIENAATPQPPIVEMHFVEDFSFTRETWWPWSILIDDTGNIYVFSGKERRLDRFDPQGDVSFIKEFPKGQAPGEFHGFDPEFSQDEKMFIVDGSQRRLTIYDPGFEIKDIAKLDLWGDIFRLDSRGNMYFLQMKFLPNTTDRQRLVLTKCSPDGVPLHEIHGYEWGQRRDSSGIYHTDAYRTQIRYKIDSFDNVYYATSNKYEINVVTPEGTIIRRITKRGRSRVLTQTEVDSFRPKKPNSRFVTDIPENMPYIADLFVLDNDYLLVITFENSGEEVSLIGDVFDEAGIYRAGVRVPKYYRWDFLLAPHKSGAVYKNGYFYTIESDLHEEDFWIKRYKVVMNSQ